MPPTDTGTRRAARRFGDRDQAGRMDALAAALGEIAGEGEAGAGPSAGPGRARAYARLTRKPASPRLEPSSASNGLCRTVLPNRLASQPAGKLKGERTTVPYRMEWVEPEVVLEHKGVTVHAAYKEDDADDPLSFWYALYDEDGEHEEFDIRDLPEAAGLRPDWPTVEEVVPVLRAAIDAGHLTAEGVKEECPNAA